MSVSVSRADGRTVLTLTSDQSSVCPPFCQLLGALCYSPGLCSKKNLLTPHRVGAQAALGALWIITALLHLGLGGLLIATGNFNWWILWSSGYFPIWLGIVFLLVGVVCVLSERYPRPIFVLLSAIWNGIAVALSIAAIALYSRGIYNNPNSWRDCNYRPDRPYRPYYYDRWNTPTPTTQAPDLRALVERCEESVQMQLSLALSVFVVLIVVSVLNLCLALSSTVISSKTMNQMRSRSGAKPLQEKSQATSKEL